MSPSNPQIPDSAMAAVYAEPNAQFELKRYPLRDIKPNEALVRITMSTICRSDIHSYHGDRPNPCPGILGHEIIGTLVAVGEQVATDLRGDTLTPGDRITWTEYFHDGGSFERDVLNLPQKAPGVRKYGHDLADEDPHFLGGFAQYCYVLPGTGMLKLPDHLSDEEAAPLNCGVATMVAVTESAAIGLGDTVVIQGLGLLGLYGCAMAKARGASTVIGIDSVEQRLNAATRFGADHVINTKDHSDDGLAKATRELCGRQGADVVIEVCGVASVIPQGIAMLRTGGRYVLAGLVNPSANVTIDANLFIKKMISLSGVHNYHPRHLIQALDFVLCNREKYPFKEIVDSTFSLEQLDLAFAKAAERSVLRAAIVP